MSSSPSKPWRTLAWRLRNRRTVAKPPRPGQLSTDHWEQLKRLGRKRGDWLPVRTHRPVPKLSVAEAAMERKKRRDSTRSKRARADRAEKLGV